MQPLFEADTVVTFEIYEKFSKAMLRNKKGNTLRWFLLEVIWLVLAGVWYSLESKGMALIMLLVALVLPFFLKFRIAQVRRKSWESNRMMHNAHVHYAFYEDYVEETYESGNVKCEYAKLHRVMETEDAFYLLTAVNQGLIIDKAGCSEALCAFIRGIKPA